jgi:hypothetical protein
MIIVSVLVLCYWASIIGIWNEIYLQEAVKQGLSVLDKIQPHAWFAFVLFIILELVYFHVQVVALVKSIASTFVWALEGCKFDTTLQSRFDTPSWKAGKAINLEFAAES